MITLDDDDSDAVDGMIRFFYSGHYPARIDLLNESFPEPKQGKLKESEAHMTTTNDGIQVGNKKWWLRHILMFTTADKYVLDHLKALAEDRIMGQLREDFGKMEGWHFLLEAIFGMGGIEGTERLMYTATKKVAGMPPSMMDKDVVRELLGLSSDAGAGLIKFLMGGRSAVSCQACGHCVACNTYDGMCTCRD